MSFQGRSFIRRIDIEDNQGDMSSDPCYVDSRGEGLGYTNTSILRYVGYQTGIV